MKIKTIDVHAKEWRDKINGNSYFSARITINYGKRDERTSIIPFRYGYGDFYLQAAGEIVHTPSTIPLWRYCRENKIILRASIERGCRKKDVIAYGEGEA